LGKLVQTNQKMKVNIQNSWGDQIFSITSGLVLAIICLLTLLPVVTVMLNSLTPTKDLVNNPNSFIVIPSYITFNHYIWLFKGSQRIFTAYTITILRTLVGTFLCLFMTVVTAYPLSKKYLPGRNGIMKLFFFTLIFSGGMIPTFLVVNGMKITDTFFALLIPCALNVYYMIIMRTFFASIPEEISEAARIDGASDVTVLFKIILPLALPSMAAIGLFYAVFHWNSFMDVVMYINKRSLWPLQMLLREILVTNDIGELSLGGLIQDAARPPASVITNCTLVVSALPLMCIYPFLQKYFVKGLMIGSVKG